MPADPTDADMARARELWLSVLNGGAMSAIAQALADERERARAPFLALADRWTASAEADERAGLPVLIHRGTAAWHIRTAAQEDPK